MRFEISYRGGTTHEVDLPGRVAVLGREPGCDVVLNDAKCSRRHAVIEEGPEGLVVRDTGSANGTHVNGRRVDRAPLRPGDTVRLGDVRLRLLPEIGETVVMAPEDLELQTAIVPTDPALPDRAPAALADPRKVTAVPFPGRRRPATVTALSLLWAAFVPASVGVGLYWARAIGGPLAWSAAAFAGLAFAGLGVAMTVGLWRLAPWARHLQVATAAVGLLVCPFTLASALVLLYVARPEVRAAFDGTRPATRNESADSTFTLSLLGLLVLGLVLTAALLSL